MAGFVERDVVIANDVHLSRVLNIVNDKGYCVFLENPNLAGTVQITVYGTCYETPDRDQATQWAQIHQANLDPTSAYLLNVELSIYCCIYVKIDGSGGGSFNNGFLRVISV